MLYNPNDPCKCEVPGCNNLTESYLCKEHLELATGLATITACKICNSIIKIEKAEIRTVLWQEGCENCKDLKALGIIKDQPQTDA